MNKHNFEAILDEIRDLHWKKNKDYGQDHDPYANVRGSTEWGVPAWKGAMVRANDKIKRLQKFAQTGELANESVEDSFKDLAVYALIALDLYRQEQNEGRVVMQRKGREINPRRFETFTAHVDPGDETPVLPRSMHGKDPMG